MVVNCTKSFPFSQCSLEKHYFISRNGINEEEKKGFMRPKFVHRFRLNGRTKRHLMEHQFFFIDRSNKNFVQSKRHWEFPGLNFETFFCCNSNILSIQLLIGVSGKHFYPRLIFTGPRFLQSQWNNTFFAFSLIIEGAT